MQSTGEMPVAAPQAPPAPRIGVRGLEYLATAVAFVVSRAILRGFGVSFNAEALDWYWQVLDPALLRGGLGESLVHLHVQPPLFNLVIGVAAGLFQEPAPLLAWGWSAVGLALLLTFQAVLRRVGWPALPAALAAIACSLSLPWIVYEHWLFYDFPCAALLACGGYCLLRDRARADPRWAAGFAATLVALAWTRSLFHLAWVIAAAVIFVAAARGARRRAAVWMLVPIILVAGLFAKNAAVFGFFGSSSWLGLSLSKMTVERLTPEERAAMMREGSLSAFAAVPPFSPLEEYEAASGSRFSDDEVPALGARLRSSGHPNFNHRAFVDISNARLRDSIAVMKARPDLYRGAVVAAVRRFFSSTVHYPPFKATLIVLAPAYRIYAATFGTRTVAIAVYGLALLLALTGMTRRGRLSHPGIPAAAAWVVLNLLWVLGVGCLLEVGENHRFRFTVTPLAWMTILGSFAYLRNARLVRQR